MKIAVVGATGPTGLLVVEAALAHGHEVVAYVRRPAALSQQPNLTVIGGQLNDTAKFAAAIAGCEVLISTLGNRNFKVRKFMRSHLPMVTAAMKQAHVQRLVLMSAWGGGQLPTHSSGLSRLIYLLISKTIFADRTESERELELTGLQWSAVYPAFLTDEPFSHEVETEDLKVLKDVRGMKISRANVAATLLELAEDSHSEKRIAIAKRGSIKR